MRVWVLLSSLLVLTGCQSAVQGPAQDLEPLTVPDPPRHVAPAPEPAPGPTAPHGFFRAWIPRETTAHGDTTEGHWVILSTTPPAVQTLEPRRAIPRPPVTKAQPSKPTVQMPLSKVPPEYLPPGMAPSGGPVEGPPGLPPGMPWPGAEQGGR